MSHLKEPIIIPDDDELDISVVSSSKSSLRDSKLSLTQKRKSSECHLLKKSKSLPGKTGGNRTVTSTQSKNQRQNSWITSSFGGFDSFSSFDDVSRKNKTRKKEQSESEDFSNKDISINLWIDKYKPQCESELAVHKKKIEEVRSWLLDHLTSKSNEILLLTGPVGVGKTATICTLSTELNFEVQEWINPTTVAEGFTFGNEYSQSQLSQFQDFLLRSNKYPSLAMFGSSNVSNVDRITQRKVILIEDLPNLFYRDAKKFHEVLLEYRHKGRCPLVLIISDSHSDESNVHKLLPKAIQLRLGVSTISFNPVANTSLVKTLNRIVSLESKKAGKDLLLPSKDAINELAQSSAGDIRTAINALQFSCQKGIQDNILSKYTSTSTSAASKKQRKESNNKGTTQQSQTKKSAGGSKYNKEDKEDQGTVKAIGGKDTSIFLFRALGKILYCKRDSSISDKHLLPSNMSHLARNQAQFCPEDVVERSHLSSEMLSLYLHQNYLDFFTDIEDVVIASGYVSDANMLSMEWMHRTSLIPYMSCIATRGLMYNNNIGIHSAPSRGGWRPLHKPQWFEVNKKVRDNSLTAKELFPEQTCPRAVLYSQIIPYLAITDVTLRTPGQISFVQQMGQYQKNKFNTRSFTDALDEKECGMSTEDEPADSQSFSRHSDSKTTTNQSKLQDSQGVHPSVDVNTEDEDVTIEDFEDDW